MKKQQALSALKISIIYAIIGCLWILLSDRVTAILFTNPDQLSIVQTYKGWFYVIVTALILFILIKNEKNTLNIAEQNFSDLFESTTEGIFRSSPEGHFINVNAAMAQIFGFASPEDMVEKISDISRQTHLSADSRKQFAESLERNGAVEKFEARNLKKDGGIIWTSTNARAIKDKNGKILYYEGFVTDITKQKNAEGALFDTEERYRMLVEKLSAVVFLDKFNQPQSTQYMSPRIKDLLGYTPEEWESGDNLWENSLHPDDKERVLAEDIRTNETGEPFRIEYRLRHRDGRYIWIKEDASLILGEGGTPLFWQGILLNITDQKQTEEALKRRDAIIKAVGFSADQFLKSSNWEENIDQVLAQFGETTQVSRVYVFKKQMSVENNILVSQAFEWCNHGIKPQINNETLQNRDFAIDGFSRWIELFNKGLPVYGSIKNFPIEEQNILEGQNILGLICIPLQIGKDWWGFIGFDECTFEREWTEAEIEALKAASNTLSTAIQRKLSEEALLNSETSYRGLFNSIHDAIYIQDINGVFLDVNDGAIKMYGYPKEYLIGKTPEILSAPDKNDMNKIARALQDAFNGEAQQFEFWGKRSNGDIFPKDVHLFKGTYFGQAVIIAVSQDITARKRNEDDMKKQLKELTVLHAIALAESIAQNTDELIQRITDIIGDTLYHDNCGVILLNEAQDKLKPHFSYRTTNKEDLTLSVPVTKGLTGKVATTGKSICSGNISLEPEYYEATNSILSELCVPISTEAKIIGVLNVESRQLNAFTRTDERLLNTIAGGMAKAIERIQLFELEQKRRKEAEIVRQAATILTNLLDLPSLHEAILEWLYKITPYDSASILELEGDRIRITAARGLPNPEKALDQIFPADNILCKIISETYEPLIIEDCEKDPRFERWGDVNSVRGWMGVPMISRGQVIGYITLDSNTPNAFTQNDAVATQTFAHQAATSLENSRLFTETKQRLDELEIVSRVSFALRAAHDTQEMLPILLNEIKASVGTDSAAIWLYDIENNELKSKETAGRFNNLPKPNFKPSEGIVGMVYSSGVSYSTSLFDDPTADPENASFFGENWSGLVVPIHTATETIGALAVAIKAPHKVESHQIRLVTTLAEIAGNAIYRSNLYQRNEKQIQRLTTLRELDTAITSSLDLQIPLNILTEHLLSKMDVSAATVLVFNPDSQTLDYYAADGFKNRENVRAPLSIGNGLAGRILLSRKAVYIKNLNEETSPLRIKSLKSEGFISYYAIPLFSKGAARGVLETYFRQPFSPSADWIEFLHTLAEQAIIAIDNAQLFENLQHSNQELSLAYDTTLEGWGKALELRDKETQGHTHRVTNLTLELARLMGIPEAELLQIRRGTLLHDIGKMGVSDNILHKEGPLTDAEQFEMRKHPQYAYDMLYPIAYLRPALDIVYCHHEWWNGSGYPRGLKGKEIPLSARIFAIIDVWDALLSDRPYRKAWPQKKVLEYILDLSGKQFDPQVVDEFCRILTMK